MSQKVAKEGVYLLYSGVDVVYVGQSENLYERIGQHIKEGTKEFDSFDVYETFDRMRLEGFLIDLFHPKYNLRSGTMWNFNNCPEDKFTQDNLELAIKTYEYEQESISVGEIANIMGEDEKYILQAINKHSDEIPAWKHKEDLSWQIDYQWYKDNSRILEGWINELWQDIYDTRGIR